MNLASLSPPPPPDTAPAPGPVLDPGAARAVIVPLYGDRTMKSGETYVSHADGIVEIVRGLREAPDLLAAGYLFGAHEILREADEWMQQRFGAVVTRLVGDLRQLMRISEQNRIRMANASAEDGPRLQEAQAEAHRRMLLAMVNDVRVVPLRLASRLQTLRYFASVRADAPEFPAARAHFVAGIAEETLDLYAPLANRLGIWQLKWELEDLALRFLDPRSYKQIARALDEKRTERESFIAAARDELHNLLAAAGLKAEVTGRPKHIASIVNKMRSKKLAFNELYDIRGLRVIVDTVDQCYEALALVHQHWAPVGAEFDDYIARPKPNGYQSLHTVVSDTEGRTIEVQIRTAQMHENAELGVAAHWRYKERVGVDRDEDMRTAWLRQLLAWRDEVDRPNEGPALEPAERRIYVLTPQGRVVELPAGATPVDFAYHVHTELGHRCRGARVNGALVPLNTPLANGQTIEIVAAKTGGPSRDWLNPELGFLHSARSRTKVRHWFNLLELEQDAASGRSTIERELQRLGRTAVRLEDLARRLGYASVEALCVAASREEFGLRSIEQALAQSAAAPQEAPPEPIAPQRTAPGGSGGVLVVGVDSLMTGLARCCRPVPPDEITGFVTRGRGVSIHRSDCANAAALALRHPERVIDVTWSGDPEGLYPVDIQVLAQDRQGLLRDVSEVFAREKLNVVGVNTVTVRGEAQMQFTVEVHDASAIRRALLQIRETKGVISARRK
ncbi:MAG TPA: bifunctional (p)ppGpp synthetase/guanosine-3',5'-bis(diphosphate) 3'-pyrophosphohydrolase [Burkholderiaceae bacterium]|nr:bifunctional (p)ppGpp synthetase/guanosine-3',5'-bis(diphosphate) 3'-pyrophosphohydrolase [Burkholderiaceae bacterium]